MLFASSCESSQICTNVATLFLILGTPCTHTARLLVNRFLNMFTKRHMPCTNSATITLMMLKKKPHRTAKPHGGSWVWKQFNPRFLEDPSNFPAASKHKSCIATTGKPKRTAKILGCTECNLRLT